MTPLKIWYIDDEPDLCEVFSEYFTAHDIVVTTFTVPAAAIDAAKKTPPDMLFIDYRLPNTNGDRVAQQFDPAIPKYLITGDIAVSTQYKFLSVFPKPYNEKEILAVLQLQRKFA